MEFYHVSFKYQFLLNVYSKMSLVYNNNTYETIHIELYGRNNFDGKKIVILLFLVSQYKSQSISKKHNNINRVIKGDNSWNMQF